MRKNTVSRSPHITWSFGSIFKQLFYLHWKRHGREMSELAELVSIHRTTLYKWMSDETVTGSAANILKVASVLQLQDRAVDTLLLAGGMKAKYGYTIQDAQLYADSLCTENALDGDVSIGSNRELSSTQESSDTKESMLALYDEAQSSIQEDTTMRHDPHDQDKRFPLWTKIAMGILAVVSVILISSQYIENYFHIDGDGNNVISGDGNTIYTFPIVTSTPLPAAAIAREIDGQKVEIFWSDDLANDSERYGQILLNVCPEATPVGYYIRSYEISPNEKEIKSLYSMVERGCKEINVASDVTPRDKIQLSIFFYDITTDYSSPVTLHRYIITRDVVNNGLIVEEDVPATHIVPGRLTPDGCIDGPLDGYELHGIFRVGGWAEVNDTNAIDRIEIWVNGKRIGDAFYGTNQGPGKETRGFIWDWDTTSFPDGEYTLQVKAFASNKLDAFLTCNSGIPVTKTFTIKNK